MTYSCSPSKVKALGALLEKSLHTHSIIVNVWQHLPSEPRSLDLLGSAKLTPQTPQHTSEHANRTERPPPLIPSSAVAAGKLGPQWVVRAGLLLPDVWNVCF